MTGASTRSKKSGSRSRSRASASARSKPRRCASCGIRRDRASCARSSKAPHGTTSRGSRTQKETAEYFEMPRFQRGFLFQVKCVRWQSAEPREEPNQPQNQGKEKTSQDVPEAGHNL